MNDHRIIRNLIARIRELEEEIDALHWTYDRQRERLMQRVSAAEAAARQRDNWLRDAEWRAWEAEEAALKAH